LSSESQKSRIEKTVDGLFITHFRPSYSRSTNVSNLPTQKKKKKENTRVSSSPKKGRRTQNLEASSAKGQKKDFHQSSPLLMLSKSQRLPIDQFPTKGFGQFRFEHFLVKIADNNLVTNRYAIIIGKTAAKLSTRRHAIKRQVLSRLAKLPETRKDILVIAQGPIGKATPTSLLRDIEKIKNLLSS
jgi:ribonuclease P protein component